MKTTKMLAILVLALGLMACQARVSEAVEMGTAFTYQGRLIDANSTADGLYDFQFQLFDDPCVGPVIAGPVNEPALDVIDGYFTVLLDFGNVFDGDARWLEIGVRSYDPCDVNAFTTLSPRQEVMPTPYALYAKNVGADSDWMVSDSNMYSIPSGNVGIGTAGPDSLLHVSGPGAETLKIESTAAQQSALAIKNADREWQWRVDAGGMFRLRDITGGNLDPIKTEADTPSNTLYLKSNGNVGIGTSPNYKLDIYNGDINLTEGYKLKFNGDSVFWHHSAKTYIGDDSASNVVTVTGGNVGIGTTSPNELLEIAKTVSGGRFIVSDGGEADRKVVLINAPGESADYGSIFAHKYGTGEGGKNLILNETGGNVGIGTTNPGTNKLEVQGGPIKATDGLIIETRTSDPCSPVTGQIWLRTDL